MNENLKAIIKMVVSHFFIITVCVMFSISLTNLIINGTYQYKIDADFPWVMMLTGLVGALPSLLFYFKNEPTKRQFIVRVIIHFFVLSASIITEGVVLGWISDFIDVLIVFSIFLVVYIMVWFFSYKTQRSTENGINKALQNLNADEEEF